jgi:hypothetical protein
MTKLKFRDILDSYKSQAVGAIDEDERFDCAGCGRRFTEPGTAAVGCVRKPNQPSHLPMSIELCEKCAKSVEAYNP